MSNLLAFFVLVGLAAVTVSAAYRGPERTRFIEKIAEQADKAEVDFDQRRAKYCREFGQQFATNPSAWTSVRQNCLEGCMLDLESRDSQDELTQENSALVFEMYRKCAKLTDNPCNDQDWAKIKKCVRQVFTSVPEFKPTVIDLTGDNIHKPHVVTEDDENADLIVGMYVNVALINRERLLGLLNTPKLVQCTSRILMVASS